MHWRPRSSLDVALTSGRGLPWRRRLRDLGTRQAARHGDFTRHLGGRDSDQPYGGGVVSEFWRKFPTSRWRVRRPQGPRPDQPHHHVVGPQRTALHRCGLFIIYQASLQTEGLNLQTKLSVFKLWKTADYA